MLLPLSRLSRLKTIVIAVAISGFVPFVTIPLVHAEQAFAERTLNISIEAGELGSTLNQLARQAGVAISYDPQLTKGKKSPAIQGAYNFEQALRLLLQGTGLVANKKGARDYVLLNADQGVMMLDPVKVAGDIEKNGSAQQAYRVENANIGVLGDRSLKNTPYSIEAYSHDLIENLQARSLADLLKGDAAINLMVGNLSAENRSLAIRGSQIDFDTGQKLDGANIRINAYDLPLEHVERVEIIKGATGFLHGFGSPGGIVNYILKRPTDDNTMSFSSQVTDSGLFLAHGDVGGRIGNDERFGYRVNLVHESGDTYINDGESDRHSESIAFDWRITPDLTWQVDGLNAEHTRNGGYWAVIPNAGGFAESIDPIDGDKRLAPKWSSYASIHKMAGTKLSWQFNQGWELSASYRYSDNGREFDMPGLYASASGDYTARLFTYANRFKSYFSQLLLTGEFETGFIRHNITTGVSYNKTRNIVSSGDNDQRTDIGTGNLSNPQEFANPHIPVKYEDADREYNRLIQKEMFFSDAMKVGEHLDVILGFRRGSLENPYLSGSDDGYDESATTPTIAVVYRPVAWLSTYASYIEALEQGSVAPASAANAFEVFEPLTSEQHEIGVKAEGESWFASAALFRLQRGLSYTTAANVFTQDGEVRYEGVELNGKFRLSPQWLVNASALWLNAKTVELGFSFINDKDVPGVAGQQASLYTEYSLPNLPLTFTAGARYIGERPLDLFTQAEVNSATLFDLGARFETEVGGNALTLRLNIDNLTDRTYWVTTTGQSANLNQGEPRIIKLGAKIDF